MKDFNTREWLLDLASFIVATIIVGAGILCSIYYLASVPTIGSVLIGLLGMIILYPAFKTWQDRIKGLF